MLDKDIIQYTYDTVCDIELIKIILGIAFPNKMDKKA